MSWARFRPHGVVAGAGTPPGRTLPGRTLPGRTLPGAVEEARRLTPLQKAFVREYALDRNPVKAATRAGYRPSTARWIGPVLARKPHINKAIAAGRQATTPPVSQARVEEELGRVAFANLMDHLYVDVDGRVVVDPRLLKRGTAAGIEELVVDERTDPKTGASRRMIRVKMADKQKALMALLPLVGR